MKYATATEHRDFFRKHQMIEFENLLKPDQLQGLVNGIDTVLVQRLGIKPDKIKGMDPGKFYMAGRDLWRADGSLKKIILQSSFAEIASELFEKKPLRIAYDQFFQGKLMTIFSHKDEKYYPLIHSTPTLHGMSCFQGIIGGLMLCLSSQPQMEKDQALTLFASQAGNGVFFDPDLPIDFLPLTKTDGSYLLIVYGRESMIYCLQKEDPHTHTAKQLGYAFGDRLSNTLNPVIYR